MLHNAILAIVQTVQDWGYLGIFILTLLESTAFPVPSELILIPAGYLAWQGQMNVVLVLLVAMLGGLSGAMLNYAFALWVGRPFLERWGKYLFIEPALLHRTDHFFRHYGAISAFTGRLIPGIRHLISIPAGLARMPLLPFCVFTLLGAGSWAVVLIGLGYTIGNNMPLIKHYLHIITIGVIVLVGAIVVIYYLWRKKVDREDAGTASDQNG